MNLKNQFLTNFFSVMEKPKQSENLVPQVDQIIEEKLNPSSSSRLVRQKMTSEEDNIEVEEKKIKVASSKRKVNPNQSETRSFYEIQKAIRLSCRSYINRP